MVDPQYDWSLKKYRELRLIWDLIWPDLALIRMKVCLKPKKSTNFFYLYRGAFEQLVCPRRGAFAGLFSKNPNARGSVRGGGIGTAGNDWCTDAVVSVSCVIILNWLVVGLMASGSKNNFLLFMFFLRPRNVNRPIREGHSLGKTPGPGNSWA